MKVRFRVWWRGEMWYPKKRESDGELEDWYVSANGDLCDIHNDYDGCEIEYYYEPSAVMMLSAGVKDGIERWVGDVVKVPYNDVYDFAHYLIVWSQEKGALYTECLALHHKDGFKDVSRGGYCVGYATDLVGGEVLGNIYENPELMEGERNDK